MKRLALIFLFLAYGLSGISQSVPFPPNQPAFGQIGPWGYNQNGTNWDTSPFQPFIYKGIPFRAMQPMNFNATRAEKYPLILFLHGAGEAGGDNNRQLINGGLAHRDAVQSGRFEGFLLYPQSFYGSWGGSLNAYLVEIINLYVRDRNVDPNRIYVHGLSGGGAGTWMMLQSYPKTFAAALPMSNALLSIVPDMPNFKHVPIWYAQGGLDKKPPPSAGEAMRDAFIAVGGEIRYQFFPALGHGTWNSMYAMPDFYEWMLDKSKLRIHVDGGRTNFCSGQAINVRMGVTGGFDGYQWMKDGALMSATTNEIANNGAGSYQVRFRRGTVWTPWSQPVVLQYGAPSPTPTITANGGTTFPALDGRTNVTLSGPAGKEFYRWSTGATTQSITVSTAGSYTLTSTDFNGCESLVSVPTVVTTTNGAGSPATPANLVATSTSETTVDLTWAYSTTDHKRFELYRSTGSAGGPYQLLGILDKDARSYSDGLLAANVNYFYQLRATNDSGGSAYAVTDAFTFKDVVGPTIPTELIVTSTSERSLSLSWKSSTDNINGLGSIVYDLMVNGQVREMNITNSSPFPNNLALAKPGVASTSEGSTTQPSAGLDGNLNTYWSSALGALEAQDWMYVDLGEQINLSSVNIRWTTDYAVGYKVQISNDAASWTDVRTVAGNAATINNLTGLTGSGRYVRILATLRRAANRRVRVVEFQVYGSKPNGQDQAYIGAVLTGLTPRTAHNLSIRARDISGNASDYTPQITALTVNDGLAYSYYEASITTLSALTSYSPVKTGKVRNFDLTPRNRNTDFAFIYKGYITVPNNGLYTFYTTSVDGSNLYISDFLIVNNDGTHATRERSGQIVLAPGTYPIRVEYFKRGSGTLQLECRYAGPGGITKTLIPESAMNSDFAAPAAPAAPTGLVAAAATHKSIKVDWQYNSAVVASGFEIYRGSTAEGTFNLVATAPGSARTFTDTNLTPQTLYYYRIKAVGPTGESALVTGDITTPGITYKYYIGSFANLNTPYFGGIAPTSTGSLANYSLSPATVPTNYGLQFDGYIAIPTTGTYTFYTRSDDGSRLFVGTTAVVANDFNQTMTERSGTIALTAGTYPITVLYRQGTSTTSGLEVRYAATALGIAKQLIPDASLKSMTYVSATTQSIPPAPAVPTNLAAVPVNGKRVDLSWTLLPTTEGIKIFRSTTAASGYVQVGTTTNASTFSDVTVLSKVTYYYKISGVNDGGESAQSGSVSVTTPNTAPTLEAVNNINLLIQTPSAIDINAADLDGDELNYTFTNLPAFASFEDFGDGYGNLNLNPGVNDAGTYSNIILTVDDSFGGVARDTFQIYVNGNHTPILQTPIGNQSITAGKRIVMQLIATDGNAADVVTFSSQNLPPFVTLQNTTNGRATLTIAPPLAERGTYGDINILAEDGNGGAAIARFDITVKEAKTGYTVLVNFNDQWDTPAPSPWNNTQRYPSAGAVISNLQDTDLANSEISLTLENGWAPNYTGPVTGDNSGVFPDVVTKTFYYIWDARVQSIRIGSLNPALKYSFKMLAATTNAAVGGPTRYTIGLQTAEVNPLNNTSNLATISDVTPDADGNVWLRIQTGAGAIYSYINALQIDASYVDGNPPAAPTNLVAAISEQQNSVDVTWKDNSPSETGFKVYRSLLPDSDFAEIGSLGVNAQAFEDVTIASNTTYYYQVIAINGYGNSQVSNTATVTTPIVAPVITATPETVSVEATQSATINITASDVSGLPVTITVTNLPSFVLFNNTGAGTANLVVLPTVNDLGHYVVTLTATNTQGASSNKDVILDITERQVRSVYVNFNVGYVQGAPWNNTNLAPLVNSTFGNLLNDQGANSGISLRLNEAWSGVNSVGTVTGNNSGVFPDNVMKTFYYEQTAAVRTILVSGLNPQKVYDFSFFASREGTGDRTTVFTIDTKSASVNASNNTTQTADLNGIIAPTGQLTIQIQRGPSSSFAYLNAMVIRSSNQTAVPVAPSNLTAKAKSKTSVELKWVDGSYNESGFQIYRATLADPTFQLVATAPANASTYLDQGLATNTQYSYKVRSINGDAPSPFSNIATVTTILNYVYINANSGYNVGQPWNNLNMTPVVGSRRSGLRDDTWTSTSIAFNVAAHPNGTTFGGANPFGKITGNNSGIYPDDVLRTFFFTEATEAARMVIDGLASNYSYNFVFFASRDGDGNRNTNYTIGSTTVTLNAAFNTSNTVQINAIKPDANGAVTIDMVSAPGAVYGYLNALVIEIYTDVPVVGGLSAKSKGSSLEENNLAAAYPNPFTSADKLQVEILSPGESKAFKVNLVNQLGVSVYESTFSIDGATGSESLTHTIEDLKAPAGIYFVNVVTDKNVRKVIKVIKR